MAKQKRDNQYYLKRLQKDRPDLYADVRGGKISVNKARQLAGLGATRTRLQELKNSWGKASLKEREEFTKLVGLVAAPAPLPVAIPPAPAARSAFGADGVMLPWARLRIREIMTKRGLTPSVLSDELGITPLRTRTTRAAIDAWLAKNASV